MLQDGEEWVDAMLNLLPDVTPVIGIRQMAALSSNNTKQNMGRTNIYTTSPRPKNVHINHFFSKDFTTSSLVLIINVFFKISITVLSLTCELSYYEKKNHDGVNIRLTSALFHGDVIDFPSEIG